MMQEAAERDAGLKKLPPGMVMMRDLWLVWPDGEFFVPTRQLVGKLIMHDPDFWGADSAYGKPLTEHRLGRLVSQAANVTSSDRRPRPPRLSSVLNLEPVWCRLGIGRSATGATGETGASGAESSPVAALAALAGCTGSDTTPDGSGARPPIEFIIDHLRDRGGANLELPVREVIAAGEAIGYSERQLTDARSKPDSRVGSRKADRRDDPGAFGGWMWFLKFDPHRTDDTMCRDCGVKPH